MLADVKRRDLERSFRGWRLDGNARSAEIVREPIEAPPPQIRQEDIPF